MQLEVGSVIEGKVTGILKFGAFVDLGGGKSGMVHISEVSSTYVNDINEFLKIGQTVKVKVVSIGEDGKIALSIKKAEPRQESRRQDQRQGARQGFKDRQKDGDKDGFARQHQPARKPVKKEPVDLKSLEYAYEPRGASTDAGFEDMLSRFKAASEDRMSDLKNLDVKKRSGRRR